MPEPKKLIVGITGMPGAGKSTVAKALQQLSFEIVSLGEIVRSETERRNLQLSDSSVGAVMIKLREENGPGAIAELSLPEVKASGQRVVIDGVRSYEEIKIFRRAGEVRVLCVHASPRVRYLYLKHRGRADAPLTWDLFEARDRRELDVGVGDAIALADDLIVNNNVTIENLQASAMKIASSWVDEIEGRRTSPGD